MTCALLSSSTAGGHEITYDAKICTCLADLNGDDRVDYEDIHLILDRFYEDCDDDGCPEDLTHNHRVDASDVRMALGQLGRCPEPGDVNGDRVADQADVDAVFAAIGLDCRPNLDLRGEVDMNDVILAMDAWRHSDTQFPRIDVDGSNTQTPLDLQIVYDAMGVDCRSDVNLSLTVDCYDYLDVCGLAGVTCSMADCPVP